MGVDVLLGLQWGDEGKGKIVDVFTPNYDIVARFQGGPNAGHTIEFNGAKHVLHLIPSGIFHPGTQCLIGNGVVVDPAILRREVMKLQESGLDVQKQLLLSKRASLILPTHKLLDAVSELARGANKIGSTLKGITPTYRDKIGRRGLRIGDIVEPGFEEKYAKARDRHMTLVRNYGSPEGAWELLKSDLESAEKAFFEAVEFLRGFRTVNAEQYIHNALAEGRSLLAEGAQGTMLDIDFGTYPYVTSSNTVAAGACTGLGINPRQIKRVFGIFKAYCTRVGSGPFPSELNDDTGEAIRKAGNEFGATTGRPRRCGWLDLVSLRYAIRLNGVTDLIMTKADVLSGLEEVKVVTAYRVNGEETQELPYDLESEFELVHKSFPAWQSDLTGTRHREEIPARLMDYVNWLEAELEVPITILSVGPDREQTLKMRESALFG